MDFDMDMDFSDISDDRVQSFLNAKLEEIRLQNQSLQTVLNERQAVLQQSTSCVPVDLHIENFWKKIFNRKYAIGFELVSSTRFEHPRVVLNCESEEYLRYKVEMFVVNAEKTPCTAGKNCPYIICGLIKKSDVFENRAYVVISFNLPQFVNVLEYDISGYVVCTLNGQDVDVPLPKLHLSVSDTASQASWLTEKNSFSNLFAITSCSNIIDLVICLPDSWTIPLISTFEIHCSLTHILLSDKAYFVANKISDLFNDTLVIIHPHKFKKGAENDIFIKVYTSDNQQLFSFLHHLLSCIPNSSIFPSIFYKASYKEMQKACLLEDFKKGLRSDIDVSYYYNKNVGCQMYLANTKTDRFNQQRLKLSEQESKTDSHYLDIIKM